MVCDASEKTRSFYPGSYRDMQIGSFQFYEQALFRLASRNL
jgi:hypothetical protein